MVVSVGRQGEVMWGGGYWKSELLHVVNNRGMGGMGRREFWGRFLCVCPVILFDKDL